jgi:hypothetical protein
MTLEKIKQCLLKDIDSALAAVHFAYTEQGITAEFTKVYDALSALASVASKSKQLKALVQDASQTLQASSNSSKYKKTNITRQDVSVFVCDLNEFLREKNFSALLQICDDISLYLMREIRAYVSSLMPASKMRHARNILALTFAFAIKEALASKKESASVEAMSSAFSVDNFTQPVARRLSFSGCGLSPAHGSPARPNSLVDTSLESTLSVSSGNTGGIKVSPNCCQ